MSKFKVNHKPLDKQCRQLLYIMVGLLVFEGIARKLVPAAGFLIFFIKDFLCLYGMYLLLNFRYPPIAGMNNLRKYIAYAFIPLIIYTGFLDPPLIIFGAKQYLLYMVLAVLVPVAFPPARFEEFKRFFAFAATLVIPTSVVAMVQNSLPASHWLNLSVDGNSLAGFAAAGYLRVSSTFSFTGQYSFFLNAMCAFLAVRVFLPPVQGSRIPFFSKAWPIVLMIMLIIGAFITGGRTAVLGCLACCFIAGSLLIYKSPKYLVNAVIGASLLFGMYTGAKALKPEYFAAFEKRSEGTDDRSAGREVTERVIFGFFAWTDWFREQEFMQTFLGNGLGVMSNGAQKISSYAENKRMTFWTETDLATSAWEGGVYLMSIWYLFRLYIVYRCFKIWDSLRDSRLRSSSAFMIGFIVINAFMGTLSLQPPLAIWFWLLVGSMIAIKEFDFNILKIRRANLEQMEP